MTQRNIFAYTAPGSDYPPYVSLNEVNGEVQLTVRGRYDRTVPASGIPAMVLLSCDELEKFADALNAYLAVRL
jgi:hypothetical protein